MKTKIHKSVFVRLTGCNASQLIAKKLEKLELVKYLTAENCNTKKINQKNFISFNVH